MGLSSTLSIGATPLRGFVVGGRLWTANISPQFVERGNVVAPDDDSVKLTQLRIGPFTDWYPFPQHGFHTLFEAAWAIQIERDAKGRPLQPAALGASFGTHVGYEWFVSNQFSFGFLGGLAFGYLSRSAPAGHESLLFGAPEFALTATYH